MSINQKYSRRDFLKLFGGSAANATTELAANLIPDTAPKPARAAQLRAENLSAARAKLYETPPTQNATRCARCNAEFVGENNAPLCPTCRAQAEQAQSLLTDLLK
jgi:rubrerythrin